MSQSGKIIFENAERFEDLINAMGFEIELRVRRLQKEKVLALCFNRCFGTTIEPRWGDAKQVKFLDDEADSRNKAFAKLLLDAIDYFPIALNTEFIESFKNGIKSEIKTIKKESR